MLTKIYEQNPLERELRKVVDALDSGIIIYPTDSVYAFGCSPFAQGHRRLRHANRTQGFTVVSISSGGRVLPGGQCGVPHPEAQPAGAFHVHIDSIVGHARQGASRKRRTIGIRIPGNAVPRAIVAALGCPLITTSVRTTTKWSNTPPIELIHERYGRDVALIDGGVGDNVPTTVVDLTGDEPESCARARANCNDWELIIRNDIMENKFLERCREMRRVIEAILAVSMILETMMTLGRHEYYA